VPRLAEAQSHHIDAIYRESYALWGAGLSFEDYRAFWTELSTTAWARKNLVYFVWLADDGTLLSSLKLYRPRLRLGDRVGSAAGIGAVFTPRARRGRGYASSLIRAVLDEARGRGDMAALLFSDVGTAIYQALGFLELAAEEAWGELRRKLSDPPRGWSLAPMTVDHLDDVIRTHEQNCRGRSIAVVRDRDYWEYLIERSRSFFSRLDGSDLSSRFQVALRNGEFVGYVAAVDGGDVWIIREVEAIDDDPELLASVIRMGASQARARGRRRCYAWLPREKSDAMRDLRVRFCPRRRAIPMLRRLDDAARPQLRSPPSPTFIPYLDQF
jgi:GNAT superfamily N-acetyltransferase